MVVIISKYGARPKKIQGFNIRIGRQIWIIQSEAKYETDTFHEGEDNMLYGYRGYVVSLGIGITKLNSFTGELEVSLSQPLEIKKNVTIGVPVVTDDKIFVYISVS